MGSSNKLFFVNAVLYPYNDSIDVAFPFVIL